MIPRDSHGEFFNNRQWDKFKWTRILHDPPAFLCGDYKFGVTDLASIAEKGNSEFISSDPKYKRKTFAIRIGYDGNTSCRIFVYFVFDRSGATEWLHILI